MGGGKKEFVMKSNKWYVLLNKWSEYFVRKNLMIFLTAMGAMKEANAMVAMQHSDHCASFAFIAVTASEKWVKHLSQSLTDHPAVRGCLSKL